MSSKVKCTCGWSWDKSDSSKKDMYVCHECGRDNSNNMKNGGWLDSITQAQNGDTVSNLDQEGIDFIQSIYRNDPLPTMFGRFPFNIGAGIGLVQSHINNQPERLSDQLGILPNPYTQAASLIALEAESERESQKRFAENKYRGKDLTNLVPEKELNPKVIDNTYVPKPKIGKLKETKKENKSQLTPYKEQREVNKVEIDNTRTNKPRVDTNYKSNPKPETKYKFTTPNISYRDDSFIIPNEVNDIKIDNTRVKTPKILKKENGGWLDNFNDSKVSLPPGFIGEGTFNGPQWESPAWGGQFQMGGVMPGAVGHMYARHGSPSKGPRRNQTDVTDASAQNGKEMQYYQQGLDWKPKTISQDGSKTSKFDFKKFNKDQKANTPLQQSINKEAQSEDSRRWFDTKEYKNQVKANQLAKDKAVVQDRKDRLNKSAASQKKSFTKDNWRQQLADETQATGDKFRMFPDEPNNFVDEWLNPGVMIGNMASDLGSAPLRAQQEDSYMPYVTSIGVPLLTGGLEGIGAKSNSEFVSNLVNPLNIVPGYKSAEKAIGQQLGNVGSGIKAQTIKNFPKSGSLLPVIDEHMGGLKQGIIDVAKGRPLFETFPITQAQKQASNIVQNKAMQEGIDFVDNWYYKNGQLRPEVENRIDNIYLTEPNYGIGAKNKNPLTLTENKLVSTRSSDLPFENISADSKEYLEANRGRVAGFNSGTTNESITLRNMGMYRLPGEEIKKTVVHESGHSAQDIGDYIPWGTMTTEYSPELKYFTSNPDTNIGKRFKNALRTPVKPSGNNYAYRTWQSSPNELHSELMSARSQLYDKFLKQGVDPEEAMGLLQNPGDETLDALYKIGGLDQFFKQNRWGKSRVPTETKRDLMRLLPAAVPAAVGVGALQQQKNGGIIKDDRGQWDHPGEITEINSNDITMQGVPYDVLGISDTGDTKLMKPGKNYKFKGKKVTEFPMAKNGLRQEQKGLQNLDNLTNFTNYNTKQPGGWLDNL